MPLAICRLTATRTDTTGDELVYSFAADGVTLDSTGALAFLNAVLGGVTSLSSNVVGSSFQLGEIFAASGGPAIFVQGLAPGVVLGTGTTGPGSHVIQIFVNALVDSPRGQRALGGHFIGPMATTTSRVATAVRATVGNWVLGIHNSMVSGGFTPVLISRTGVAPTGIPIEGYRVDDVFDILRSRRLPREASSEFLPA